MTVTVAVLGVHVPLEIVHVYTYVPGIDAVAVDEPKVLLLKVLLPGPDVCVQSPVPEAGVLPPRDAVVSDPHIFCVAPAVAVVGVV